MPHPDPSFAPKTEAERLKAFELFLSSGMKGRRMSTRAIAQQLGCAETTVRRWKTVDKWQERLNENLDTSQELAEATSSLIKRRLRKGLMLGLNELKRIVKDKDARPADKIAAVKALAEIATRIDAVTSGVGSSAPAGSHEFKDDIPEVHDGNATAAGDGSDAGGPTDGPGVAPPAAD